jgi:Putative zinc-finger
MKHPNRDQWVPFIFGEISPENKLALQHHLAECAECQAQVATWRRTLKRLDAWKVTPPRRAAFPFGQAARWAAAAAVILGIGFLAGHSLTSRANDPARLETSIRNSVKAEMAQQVQASVAAELQHQIAMGQLGSSNLLASFETRLAQLRKAESAELASELASLLEQQDEHNRAVIQAVLSKLQDEHQKDYVALRTDLETVALAADQQLQDTQTQLALLNLTKPE